MADADPILPEKPKVAVITAAIGHPILGKALESVCMQTCAEVEHWVVVDGPGYRDAVEPVVEQTWRTRRAGHLLVLPERTGMGGWCSHRIYAAVPMLVNADFVCFLDQDNWFEPDHVEQLLGTAKAAGEPAAYTLRTIRGSTGEFICQDECQSLGLLRESFDTPGLHHIDTNCWLLATRVANRFSSAWLQKYHGDRRFARAIMKAFPRLPCTRAYSVHYTVESRRESATAEYFLRGNRQCKEASS